MSCVPLVLLFLGCADPPLAVQPVGLSELSTWPHDAVATMVHLSWTQDAASDATWIEFSTDGETWTASPSRALEAGSHDEVVLGLPADTDFQVRVIAEVAGTRSESERLDAVTGSLPDELTQPQLHSWEPDLASDAGFVLGTVDLDGGPTYAGPWWVFIADRQGNIVWYHDLDGWQSMFARVARDGSHLAWSRHNILDLEGEQSTVHRQTLDGSLQADVSTPGLGWAWDETDDGTVLYDRNRPVPTTTLEAVAPDGSQQTLWDCAAWLAPLDEDSSNCYTNTVNWSPDRDSVMWSTYWGDWIAEVDRATGQVLWYAGSLDGGLDIIPEDAQLDLQHFPNFTPDGTLIVSTHIPDQEGEQRIREFDVGADSLEQVWVYGEGVDGWAQYSGEAQRLQGGNTLINYGTGGEIREVTPDGELAWSLRFGEGWTLGHSQLVEDLYALNGGW